MPPTDAARASRAPRRAPVRRARQALAVACVVAASGCAASGTPAAGPPGHAVVTKVVDGDTIRVRIGGAEEAVRLIGVDTPETHGAGGLVECYGKEAAAATARLVPRGVAVRLVGDVEQRDHYGRLLAYVYRTDDDLFVNLTLARDGFADALPYPPNVTHAPAIAAAVTDARAAGRGLWGACGGPDTPIG
jgi:micrococcal nuclease